MKLLSDVIAKLPASAARGQTLESLNALREQARLTTDRACRLHHLEPTSANLEKIAQADREGDIAFETFRLAYYGR